MATQQLRHKGVTPPISTTMPTPAEKAENDALIDELKRQNNFEAGEETERRKKVLQAILKITLEFVKVVLTEKKKAPHIVNTAGGKIFTYGSYRLGVYGPGSDIDTLVVVPRDVNRDDFFKHFPSILEKMAPPGAIEELTTVQDAFVPIIKLEFSGISIDLIFARLDLPSVPWDLDLKDKNLLKNIDERDLRSLNGTRVTDEIMELVPQQKTFRTALRAIKLWAQRRAIYANVMGFPGGVAWAMLVARTCQLYPQAPGAVIVGKCFNIMSKWSWPQPVVLKEIEAGPLKVRVWNPQIYHSDRFHLMPIITPAYPSMCATHNVTLSTRDIILKELARGGDIVNKIFIGQLEWKELFERHSFFTQGYKYYLGVVSSSLSKEAQQIWSGLVESKIRHLVMDLENGEHITLAHPFNKGFERVHTCKNQGEVEAVIAGDLRYQSTDTFTETTDVTNDPKHNAAAQGDADNLVITTGMSNETPEGEGKPMVYTTTYYIGIELVQDAKRILDISFAINKFRDLCYSWPNYRKDLSHLSVVHTRSYDLPADVFESGDVRPTKAKKKVAKKEAGTMKEQPESKKRKLDANGVEDSTVQQLVGKRRQSEHGIPVIAT